MIVTSAAEFRYCPKRQIQSADLTMREALLIKPNAFGFAAESAKDNIYMQAEAHIDRTKALRQHEQLAKALGKLGVPVNLFESQDDTPDAVYPNNVFAFRKGYLIVGNMLHPVRRKEAEHQEIRKFYLQQQERQLIDLSNNKGVAELTGSMIIDHARSIAYTGLSQRCDLKGAEDMHRAFAVSCTFVFKLAPNEYHTNIALSVLAGRGVVVAPDGFAQAEDAEAIAAVYGNKALMLTKAEKNAFIGNCLAVNPDTIMMSQFAYNHLNDDKRDFLRSCGFSVYPIDVSELEKGGGSLRCLIAEVF